MVEQLDFFGGAPVLPDGFRYQRELITTDVERSLLDQIRMLPFEEFAFHGYVGKRRTVSFGWTYDFSHERLEPAGSIPAFLLGLRDTAAAFAGVPATDLQQALVTEYGPDAGIGWHRDKGVFGEVVGISLLSACRFRLRRKVGQTWQRITLDAEPRSAYLLRGPARTEWEHSVPAVNAPRYSVTFRTLRLGATKG